MQATLLDKVYLNFPKYSANFFSEIYYVSIDLNNHFWIDRLFNRLLQRDFEDWLEELYFTYFEEKIVAIYTLLNVYNFTYWNSVGDWA